MGGVFSQGVSAPGGVCSGGVSAAGGCLLLEGVSAFGPGGVYPFMQWVDTSPVNRMTDACENITLATTSLRLVKMDKSNNTKLPGQ